MGKRKKERETDQATIDILGDTIEKLVDEIDRLKRRIAAIEARPDPFRPIGPVTPWIEPTTKPPYPWEKYPEQPNPARPTIIYSNSSDPESTPHQ